MEHRTSVQSDIRPKCHCNICGGIMRRIKWQILQRRWRHVDCFQSTYYVHRPHRTWALRTPSHSTCLWVTAWSLNIKAKPTIVCSGVRSAVEVRRICRAGITIIVILVFKKMFCTSFHKELMGNLPGVCIPTTWGFLNIVMLSLASMDWKTLTWLQWGSA